MFISVMFERILLVCKPKINTCLQIPELVDGAKNESITFFSAKSDNAAAIDNYMLIYN